MHEMLEREAPTPPEWTFLTRCALRSARGLQKPVENSHGVAWSSAGAAFKKAVRRLEDADIDGAGLRLQGGEEGQEEGISVPGVGEVGFDISAKSEAWRRGYWEALMGLAKIAERLDGAFSDVSRKIVVAPEFVVGPRNPDPMPMPPWAPEAPLEENCVPAFESPETFYLKILTTKGLNNRQRLDAALAYGEWLDFKNMPETAEEVYKWALDIATSSLERSDTVIDKKTAVIRPDAPIVTENVLSAATAMATHYAQMENPAAALPIYLSVLRARRAAPLDPNVSIEPSSKPKPPPPQTDIAAFAGYLNAFVSLFVPAPYPPPPPSGEESLVRHAVEDCEEAKLMAYIGEILFATSKSQRDLGLTWTKDAVELAQTKAKDDQVDRKERLKCVACLAVGLANWRRMVDLLLEEQDQPSDEPRWTSWKNWIGLGGKGDEKAVNRIEKLQQEEMDWSRCQKRFVRDNLREKLDVSGTPILTPRLLLLY
jgi:hypothetical protein